MATPEMVQRLPRLDDDCDIGIEKEHTVPRDGSPDLKFRGTLLASAAPEYNNQNRWREYRVYRTRSGRYVFSSIGRSLMDGERDKFEATPWPYSTSNASNKVGEETREQFANALTNWFEFDQVAKELYRKLKIDTAEHID